MIKKRSAERFWHEIQASGCFDQTFPKYEETEGPLAALMLWEHLQAGDFEAFEANQRRLQLALTAARWCTAPTDAVTGWPVRPNMRGAQPASVIGYVSTVSYAIQGCAALVDAIMADLGPIAYADRGALELAVIARLAEFSTEELVAISDQIERPGNFTLDMTGVTGHAWNSNVGRFHNEGSGWRWTASNVVMFDASNLYGREVKVELSSMASGTQRRALTSSSAISTEALQRARAAVQVGSPSGS